MTNDKPKRDPRIFFASVFFVLGFSSVFSVVGILLQTVLSHASAEVEVWLSRIGGAIIILFGLFLLDLVTPKFLQQTHAVGVKMRFKSYYLTSFVFGAAFAVGWTPCVSAALGAILALATTSPGSAFVLLFAYTLGIGLPFLLVGLFTTEAEQFIEKAGSWLRYVQYVFGVILIALGVLIFTDQLSKIADFAVLTSILQSWNIGVSAGGDINSVSLINLGIAFIAGLGSFLSPCVLPIIPGFLSFLASTAVKKTA